LNAEGSTLRDDLVDKEFFFTLLFAIHAQTHSLLELSDGGNLVEQGLEEA
jgi:hypothetical protein